MDTIYSMIYWIYDWIMTICKTKCNNTIAPLHILEYNNELIRITLLTFQMPIIDI